MFEIILETWYQEVPEEKFFEVYNECSFSSIEGAIEFLSENKEKILDNFPVQGIEIKKQ